MTINEEIEKIIEYQLNQYPAPKICKITKTYENNFCDITIDDEKLQYVKTIGSNIKTGATGVLIFINGSNDNYIVIT